MTMLTRIKEYFKERGVTPADVPRVILTHELISVAFLAFTWAACYQIQPSQSPLFAPVNKTLRESNNVVIAKSRQSFEGLLARSERRISHEWLSKRGIDSVRVAVSLAESTLFRKFAKPVTIPAKLWLTLKCVQGFGMEVDKRDGSASDRSGGGGGGGGGGGKGAKDAKDARKKQPRGRQSAAAALTTSSEGGGTRVIGDGGTSWGEGRNRGRLGRTAPADGAPASARGQGRGWGGWGGKRSRRRRKAICPPGRRGGGGGGGAGCFVPALLPVDLPPRTATSQLW